MSEYVPGTCNIGAAEIESRRRSGWAGIAFTILLAAALWALGVAPVWRLTLFIPASVAASGFLQARYHFCAGFGMVGRYNFGALGRTESVQDAEARKADLRKALAIGGGGAAIGLAVALVAYVLP